MQTTNDFYTMTDTEKSPIAIQNICSRADEREFFFSKEEIQEIRERKNKIMQNPLRRYFVPSCTICVSNDAEIMRKKPFDRFENIIPQDIWPGFYTCSRCEVIYLQVYADNLGFFDELYRL